MTWHLHGCILTPFGVASNNRGEKIGNVNCLQVLHWHDGTLRTGVSAEAIRFALRHGWQRKGDFADEGDCETPDGTPTREYYRTNRRWDPDLQDNVFADPKFANQKLPIDDDVLGYMRADAARTNEAAGKGAVTRRGVLQVSHAVSTSPYEGDSVFHARSGEKERTSLYSAEVHATRFQYFFSMTPKALQVSSRAQAVLEGLAELHQVAGNHARFLYDFSPEVIVLRWTHDPSSKLGYMFDDARDKPETSASRLAQRIRAGDIEPAEVVVGGRLAQAEAQELEALRVTVFSGVRAAVHQMCERIRRHL